MQNRIERSRKKKRNVLHVSEERGPYYTIQEAIDAAQDGTTILVSSGY